VDSDGIGYGLTYCHPAWVCSHDTVFHPEEGTLILQSDLIEGFWNNSGIKNINMQLDQW